MTTPTDLSARVEEAQRLRALYDRIAEANGLGHPFARSALANAMAAESATFPALAADWQRLRDLDQERVDQIAHYRTLALQLGAKPEQMRDDFDRFVWKVHVDEQDELVRLRERARVLTEALETVVADTVVIAAVHPTDYILKAIASARAALSPEPKT